MFQVRAEELTLASVNVNFSNLLCLALVRVVNLSFSQALSSLTNFETYLSFFWSVVPQRKVEDMRNAWAKCLLWSS